MKKTSKKLTNKIMSKKTGKISTWDKKSIKVPCPDKGQLKLYTVDYL
jgi:hypothetical protein